MTWRRPEENGGGERTRRRQIDGAEVREDGGSAKDYVEKKIQGQGQVWRKRGYEGNQKRQTTVLLGSQTMFPSPGHPLSLSNKQCSGKEKQKRLKYKSPTAQ